jgi:solute carrier family 25 protein 39/40
MLRRIFIKEGLGGIYAGLAPTLVMSVPNTVLYFTSYDEIVTRLRRRVSHTNFSDAWIPLVSGGLARVLASTVTSPLELIRTRQASLIGQSQMSPGMMAEFRVIVKAEGAGALFQGLVPTLWRDVPFSAIYWFCLEQFKLQWKRNDDGDPERPSRAAGEAFVNGAVSGMIAAGATTPFDVVKTRQQAVTRTAEDVVCHHNGAAVYKPAVAVNAQRTGIMATMKEIMEKEGIAGLWRGNQTRMIKVAPACAIMISCYEAGKQIME